MVTGQSAWNINNIELFDISQYSQPVRATPRITSSYIYVYYYYSQGKWLSMHIEFWELCHWVPYIVLCSMCDVLWLLCHIMSSHGVLQPNHQDRLDSLPWSSLSIYLIYKACRQYRQYHKVFTVWFIICKAVLSLNCRQELKSQKTVNSNMYRIYWIRLNLVFIRAIKLSWKSF